MNWFLCAIVREAEAAVSYLGVISDVRAADPGRA